MLRKLKRCRKRKNKRSHPSQLVIYKYIINIPCCLLYRQFASCRLYASSSQTQQQPGSEGICLGRAPGCVAGRTGPCAPRTAPTAGRSAGASRPGTGGEPGTASRRGVLPRRRRSGGGGGEALGGSGGSSHLRAQGSRSGGCQPRTSPGPWTRNPASPLRCWCPTCPKEEEDSNDF